MPCNAFLPQAEKHVKSKVSLMQWSPKLDLLAVACCTGELLLYRLGSREKIWSLPAPESGCEILSLCWRPDGKVIAVGYSSAKHGVRFVYMEKAEVLWKFSAGNEVISQQPASLLEWFIVESAKLQSDTASDESLSSDNYLPKPPPLLSETGESCHAYQSGVGHLGFHVLLLGDLNCNVTILANGIFPIVKIHCKIATLPIGVEDKIIAARVNPSMGKMCAALEHRGKESTGVSVQVFDLCVVNESMDLYNIMAQKVFLILSLTSYMTQAFDNMSEACDAVVQEMESHFTNFLVKNNSAGTIGDDFMQLLIWGKATESLKHILTQHLTKKGIKKLGQLVEMAYAEIQKLLSINFQSALDSLYYHLTEIKGLVANHKDILPFFEHDIDDMLTITGSLFLKMTELLQVIDNSLKNFKAFFRWLYVSMLKMQNEVVDKLGRMSENEIAFVADFIYEHFNARHKQDVGMKKAKHFHLEKVCQYLKDEVLTLPLKTTANDWYNFVKGSNLLSHSGHMFHHRQEASFRQIFNELSYQLRNLMSSPKQALNDACVLMQNIHVFSTTKNFTPICQLWIKPPSDDENQMCVDDGSHADECICVLTCAEDPPTKETIFLCLYPSVTSSKAYAMKLGFNPFEETPEVAHEDGSDLLKVVDFVSYNPAKVTAILSNGDVSGKNKSYLVQVPLSHLHEQIKKTGALPDPILGKNSRSFCGKSLPTFLMPDLREEARELKNGLHPVKVVTSGARDVSCVLSSDLHRLVPFLMDHSEGDEDDLDETDG